MVSLADQRSSFALVIAGDCTLASHPLSSQRESEPLSSRLAVVATREDAVLNMQSGIDFLARGTGARLEEALLEVVAQEGIQDWVHGRVRVTEEASEQEDAETDHGLTHVRRSEDERHLPTQKFHDISAS